MTKWAVGVGVLVLVLGLMWWLPYQRSRNGVGNSALGDSPNSGITGTSGRDAGAPEDASPATLHDLETVTGSLDPHEMIGRRVDFHVKVGDLANSTSFWVGDKDNRMLVVLGRDNRSEAQRDRGTASANNIQPVKAGQMAHITGSIQEIPSAESRFSWGANDSLRRDLKDQKVYIRADNVTPEG